MTVLGVLELYLEQDLEADSGKACCSQRKWNILEGSAAASWEV